MTKESRDELLERILEETARKPYKPSGRPTAGRPSQVSAKPSYQSAERKPVQPKSEPVKQEQQTQVFSSADVNSVNQPPVSSVQQNTINVSTANQQVTQREMESAAEKIQKIKQEKAAAAKAAIMRKAEIDNSIMMQQQNAEASQFQEQPSFSEEDEKVNIFMPDDEYGFDDDFSDTDDVSDATLLTKICGIIQYAAYISFVVLVVFNYIFSFSVVSGDSMYPTLNGDDRILALEVAYTPQRGDIVIIDNRTAGLIDENGNVTEKEALNCMISKRIVAVSGDTIDFDFENGTVTVNDEVLQESYISEPTTRNEEPAFEYPLTIPEGYVFVLGDNRNISMDSRHSNIGLVPEDEVIGKAILRVYPFNAFGTIE